VDKYCIQCGHKTEAKPEPVKCPRCDGVEWCVRAPNDDEIMAAKYAPKPKR